MASTPGSGGDVSEAARIARNEDFFRQVNERVAERAESEIDDEAGRRYQLMCECARTSCEEMVEISLEEQERVRADPCRFFVAPGHVVAEHERVIERCDRYWIVEKVGAAGDLAKRLEQ